MDNLQKRQRMAWDLYRDYIAVGAKHELNLDSMSWLLVHMHVERWKDFSFGEKKKGISW